MSNLRSIEDKKDVKETIEEALKMVDGLDAVMILGLTKEGNQVLRTSTMSGHKKAFLVAFLNAWLHTWFQIKE